MKNFWVLPFLWFSLAYNCASATGFNIKTSSIIDQPAIEVMGDYNGNWYVIGFEKPNHPEKPARFYILKYAAGFPTAKSSPVYPPFGEKTDYLTAAIVNKKLCIFYSRTERLVERPDMVDKRDGYKQIPKILRQDYDPVTLLPAGEPVVVFDESAEHFAASGIAIAHSEDKSKTAILIKHYFRQQKFKVLLVDNNKGPVFEHSYELKTEKDLVNFKSIVVSNAGQIFIEAKTQEDPLHPYTKGKKLMRYYFFSINNHGDEPQMLNLAEDAGSNEFARDPMIAVLNTGELLVSYARFASEHSPVLKGISVAKYRSDFSVSGAQEISPDPKFIAQAANYQKTKEKGLEYVQIQQLLPLENGNFVLVAEYQRNNEVKDKVTNVTSTIIERNYLVTYRLDNSMVVKAANFIDKKQSARTIGYAFSAQAFKQGNDAYILYNEDCEGDDEHGLYLLGTKLPANGAEPVTQKVVHTSEDFFTGLDHIYTGSGNRILFTEQKVVDFSVEARELKLLEVTIR